MRRTPRPTGRDRLPSATGVKARKETEDLDGSGMMKVLVAPHRAARPGLGAIADARRWSTRRSMLRDGLLAPWTQAQRLTEPTPAANSIIAPASDRYARLRLAASTESPASQSSASTRLSERRKPTHS